MNVMSKLLGTSSPFDALLRHLDKVMECVDLIEPIVNAALNGETAQVKEHATKIYQLEHDADEIKEAIRDNLPRELYMPVSRIDFLAFLREQDSLADKAEDLAMMLGIRTFRLPVKDDERRPFIDEFRKLAHNAVSAAREVAKMTRHIDEVKKRGFKGPIAQEMRELASVISDFEFQTDKSQYRLIRTLLSQDSTDWPFVESYTLMQVISALGKLADHCERMSDYLRLMIAE